MNVPVPFFRPEISEEAIQSVAESLRSGWLTSGPKVREFQEQFASAVGAKHAIALNSATAALHLSVRALNLKPGEGVLVPTHTFAATAEVVQYEGGIPILVDCCPQTLNLDIDDAERQLYRITRGEHHLKVDRVVGIMPVHVAGLMLDMDVINRFAAEHGLWVVEDAAHAFPAGYVSKERGKIVRAGEGTASATCFSFYANKTITTGEGGMLVTDNDHIAEQASCLSLHGLSSAAWRRFEAGAAWDYKIIEAGYKYNLTDLAAAIGIDQLNHAEEFRQRRRQIAEKYDERLQGIAQLELPVRPSTGLHSWHLYILKLNLGSLSISRNEFCAKLSENNIGFSVHWRPLHLHPLYQERFKYEEPHLPAATHAFDRIISLPIFPAMTDGEQDRVCVVVQKICSLFAAQQSPSRQVTNAAGP